MSLDERADEHRVKGVRVQRYSAVLSNSVSRRD